MGRLAESAALFDRLDTNLAEIAGIGRQVEQANQCPSTFAKCLRKLCFR
jgi:hypothetical protein